MKTVENYLRPAECGFDLDRKTVTNIKYYVTMLVGLALAGDKEFIASKIAGLPSVNITEKILSDSLNTVLFEYKTLGASDQVAKGPLLTAILLSRFYISELNSLDLLNN